MASSGSETAHVNARIVYWGVPGADASGNLHRIHSKLRADHRGELRRVPTRLDPTVSYEALPIELGVVKGVQTRLQIIAVPAGPEHAPTRKQLLDRVDGLVLIVDCRRDRIQENLACLQELRQSLEAYGRSLSDLPVVVQYNRPDQSDPGIVEELHRQLGLKDAAAFETVAAEGSGVLQALTTISKRVVRVLRERGPQAPLKTPTPVATQVPPETSPEPTPQAEAPPAAMPPGSLPKPATRRTEAEITLPAAAVEPEPTPPDIAPEPQAPPPTPSPRAIDVMENAILAEQEEVDQDVARAAFEAQTLLDRPWDQIPEDMKSPGEARIGADFRIVSVGTATRAGARAVRVPLVLGNAEGESVTVALTIQLDPILNGEET